jgi:hypothetical protein
VKIPKILTLEEFRRKVDKDPRSKSEIAEQAAPECAPSSNQTLPWPLSPSSTALRNVSMKQPAKDPPLTMELLAGNMDYGMVFDRRSA